jgi:DNA-binding IclR family transcriptional regulator
MVNRAHWNGKLSLSVLPVLAEEHRSASLRSLAKEYGVSHEAVRRALKTLKP